MKSIICCLMATLGLATTASVLRAAEEPKAAKAEKKELRVLVAPDRERHVVVRQGDRREKPEMERATFLGVEVSPVPAMLSSQLGLPRGTGLVVGHVAPKSAAADVLQEHDILLKLDDQILIEARQLSVLIRNHQEGDEVSLTYLRGGQRSTVRVKLGTHEVPKLSWTDLPGSGDGRVEFFSGEPGSAPPRAEVDRVLSLMRRAHSGEPVRIHIDRREGPGFRAMSINPGSSNLVFTDEEGSLELTNTEGRKSLVVKNAAGEQIFSGPVTTPEERRALPPGVRERLERLEGMRDVTFETDGEFKGAESGVVRPLGRGISQPRVPVAPPRPSLLF